MKKERKPLFEVPTEHEKEWQGMPEFTQKDITSIQQIIVHFESEEDVQKFAKLIDRSLSNKTQSVWYPAEKIRRHTNKRYIDKEELENES